VQELCKPGDLHFSQTRGGGLALRGIPLGKFEARISNFETNPNIPNSNLFSLIAGFEILNFEFVSDFDIRISDFSMAQTCLVPPMQG
jgi:hypothetical protein